MDEKMKFIVACRDEEHVSFAELCRRAGISRKTGYKWLARYESGGAAGLSARASTPRRMARSVPAEVEDAIVLLRKQQPRMGPKKLRVLLVEKDPSVRWPALSTMGEILQRQGLIRPKRKRVRVTPSSSPLGHADAPNALWCIDFKGHFALDDEDKTRCHPLTLTDAHSRFILKCEGLMKPRVDAVRQHLELAFTEFGLPARIRSDNGPPFASLAPGGLSELSVWWLKLGIVPERIEPGHPEQNGRHERMHRTLKEEATRPAAKTMQEQQRVFDAFRCHFNKQRPHEALGQVPPGRIYEPSSRTYPCPLRSPAVADDCEKRLVNQRGAISWAGKVVPLTRLLMGEPVGLRAFDENKVEVFYGPVLLGVLDKRDKKMVLRRPTKTESTP
jgi:transposase InsO family protein